MEDEDNFLVDLVNKSKSKPVNNSSYISNPDESSGVVGFKNNDISQYDDNFLPNLINKSANRYDALSKHRASHQPTFHKLGNALGRLTNIIPEAVGSVASALDFEDYFNQDDEVGNWLTDITEQWKQSTNEALPILEIVVGGLKMVQRYLIL
jgi:uncharacterized protein YejL (UPF0352 family)